MNVRGKDITVVGRLVRIGRLAAEKYEFLDDPDATLDALRASEKRIDLFTFMQGLTQRAPKCRYLFEWDNLAAVPVSSFDHWWSKQINGKTRNMVRRAEKAGVTVREVPFDDALVAGIKGIYDECPTRQGKPFKHYRKSLAAVGAENGTFLDRSVFLGAFLDTTLIGFAKLVSDEHQGQAGLMQIVSMIRHRDKAPTNALIAHAVRSCGERGIPYLVYANFSYVKKQHDTIAEFKQHNGFERIELPRYYVPLNAIGRTALKLGLHHPLRNRVPESVLERLRTVRRFWHHTPILAAKESL